MRQISVQEISSHLFSEPATSSLRCGVLARAERSQPQYFKTLPSRRLQNGTPDQVDGNKITQQQQPQYATRMSR